MTPDRRNRRVFLLALLLASISALAAYVLLASRTPTATAPVEAAAPSGEPVLVAARAITEGETLTAGDVEVAYVPAAAKGARVLTDSAQAVGQVALVAIPKGEQILAGSIGAPPAAPPQTYARDVPVGMRAVTIESEETIGVGGLLQPGDRVDVVAGMNLKPVAPARSITDALAGSKSEGEQFPMAELIVQDVEVLAIGQALDAAAPADPLAGDQQAPPPATAAGPATRQDAKSVTLLVDPTQALRLVLAVQADATFRLLLRAPGDATVTELPPALIANGLGVTPPFQLVGANLAPTDLVITDARFRAASVPAGGTLEFEATVRNVSSRLIPAGRGGSVSGHVYPVGQTWQTVADPAPDGIFTLGITSERTEPQTYPWRWELASDLPPGETATVTGSVQAPNEPGVQRWWFGTLLQPGTVLQDGVAPAEITIEPATAVVVTASTVEMRESPWPNAASVVKLSRGARADVLQYQDGWFQVRSGDKDGWVSDEFVGNAALPAAPVDESNGGTSG